MGQSRLRIAILCYDSRQAQRIKSNLTNFAHNGRRTGFY